MYARHNNIVMKNEDMYESIQQQKNKNTAGNGVREQYNEEDEYEEEDEMDERNDVYTAKGGQGLAVPITTNSQSSIRGGGR